MLSRILKAAALTTAIALMPLAAAQAQTTMKLASATINDVQHEWQKVFAKELEARVGDAVKTEIYPASQLGAENSTSRTVPVSSANRSSSCGEYFVLS